MTPSYVKVTADGETYYPGLGLLIGDEFSRRERALQDRLASGKNRLFREFCDR